MTNYPFFFWENAAAFFVLTTTFLFVLFNIKRAVGLVRRFHREEIGSGYSLSFALTLPFYLLFICVIFETTFVTIAKIGTTHAALGAARAAIVRVAVSHPNARDSNSFIPEIAETKASEAAVEALVPFSSGFDAKKTPSASARVYLSAYKDFISKTNGLSIVKDNYILARYSCAENRTSVTLKYVDKNGREIDGRGDREPWNKFIVAEVTYQAPYRIAVVGQILGGTKGGNGRRIATIVSSAKLQVECPQNDVGYLGVAVPWLR